MPLIAYTCLTLFTCAYWLASLFTLLLRLGDPRLRTMAQYGGRHISPLSLSSLAATLTVVQSTTNAVNKTNKFSCCMNYVKSMWLLRWICKNVSVTLVWLERSFMCRWRVSRKHSFCAFYITGAVSSLLLLFLQYFQLSSSGIVSFPCSEQVLKNMLWDYDALPLIAFLIHCTVRLWECFCVHQFRSGKGDSVTLFAALAGCSFYVFAANSSSVVVLRAVQIALFSSHVYKEFDFSGSVYQFSFPVMITVVVCLALHLLLQALQVLHHAILARLRSDSSISSNPYGNSVMAKQEHAKHDKDGPSKETPSTSGAVYHFPYRYLFVYVLEPHYTCEIVMYLVNAISIWSLLYSSTPLLLMTACGGEGDCHASPMLLLVFFSLLLNYAAPLGVLLFSLFNLAITASEHRCYWNHVNGEREKKEQLPRWDLFYRLW